MARVDHHYSQRKRHRKPWKGKIDLREKDSDHKCLANLDHQMLLETVLFQDEYSLWYQCTGGCECCYQRALTYVIQSDDIMMLDRMLRWTECHKHIMDIFLAACYYEKPKIVDWLLYLWQRGLFFKDDLQRVFCEYNFATDMEDELACAMSQDVEKYSSILFDIAAILDMNPFQFVQKVSEMHGFMKFHSADE